MCDMSDKYTRSLKHLVFENVDLHLSMDTPNGKSGLEREKKKQDSKQTPM